jgi:anti-sigma factor RsiW
MTCDEAKLLLGAYSDHELGPVEDAAVRAHIEKCESCREELTALTALRSAVTEQPRFTASESLHERIRRALPLEEESPPRKSPIWLSWFAVAPFALGALCASLVWFMIVGRPNGADQLAEEVVSSHIRSLMPGHLLDVISSDRHVVKPWFAGKVGLAPFAWDLGSEGFSLAGGRLDYLDGKRTAVIVYRHKEHVINLFVWPQSDLGGLHSETVLGYHMWVWRHGGLEFAAVSDMDLPELQRFAQLYTQQIGSGATEH